MASGVAPGSLTKDGIGLCTSFLRRSHASRGHLCSRYCCFLSSMTLTPVFICCSFATMRRLRNVAASSLILIATVYFLTQHQSVLPNTGYSENSYELSENLQEGKIESKPIWTTPNNNGAHEISLQEGLSPPSATPLEDPSFQEVSLSESSDTFPPFPPSVKNSPVANFENTLPVPITNIFPSTLDQAPSPVVHEENQLPPSLETNKPNFEAEFAFQQDLDLELPVEILKKLSAYQPHNYDTRDNLPLELTTLFPPKGRRQSASTFPSTSLFCQTERVPAEDQGVIHSNVCSDHGAGRPRSRRDGQPRTGQDIKAPKASERNHKLLGLQEAKSQVHI